MKTIGLFALGAIVVLFSLLMLTKITPYFPTYQPIEFLTTKTDQILAKQPFKWAFYIHITSSWWVMLTGLIQFIPSIVRAKPHWHRLSGKIYVLSILALAAPSGLILAIYANGGLPAKVGFSMQCLVWWSITFLAWRAIKQKKWLPHT